LAHRFWRRCGSEASISVGRRYPAIFAQAAKSDLLYVAAVPSGASAILLPAGSPLQTLPDLKGKRVAFARGSGAHNLTIAALEKAGLRFDDIQAIALAPADAAAAFEKGAIDAWTIWDPFYALYETRPGVRVLVESTGIAPQNSFFVATRSFVETNPDITAKVITNSPRSVTGPPRIAPKSPTRHRWHRHGL